MGFKKYIDMVTVTQDKRVVQKRNNVASLRQL